MKRLNSEEIKYFASMLDFTESEAKDITDLFYRLKMENKTKNWRVCRSLDSVEEYIKEWEDHWHREVNFSEFFKYEKESMYYAYDEDAEWIFASEDSFKEHKMNNSAFQLPNNEMVVVVC